MKNYLSKNSEALPDVPFLALNIPRKNGSENLSEIKADLRLKKVPAINYSTASRDEIANELYEG